MAAWAQLVYTESRSLVPRRRALLVASWFRFGGWRRWNTSEPSHLVTAIPACLDACFRHDNHLAALRLYHAHTSSLSVDDAHLFFWCRRQLGLFASLADEQHALAALPTSHASVLTIYVRASCAIAYKDTSAILWYAQRVQTMSALPEAHPLCACWRTLQTDLAAASANVPSTWKSLVSAPAGTTAAEEWNAYVTAWRDEGADREYRFPSYVMEEVMTLVGHEDIKRKFMTVYESLTKADSRIHTRHVCIVGGRGSGKTRWARLYTKLLIEHLSVSSLETYGQKIVDKGVEMGYRPLVDTSRVLLVEQADVLDEGTAAGRSILRAIPHDLDAKVRFHLVLTSEPKLMTRLLGNYPALHDRLPTLWTLPDFTETDLAQLFVALLNKRTDNKVVVADGPQCQALRIVASRISTQGSNAHGMLKVVDLALTRKAARQRTIITTDKLDPLRDNLTFADIVGPDPLAALEDSAAYRRLMNMIGLARVKAELVRMVRIARENYQRELRGEPKADLQLNRVLIGSPGTGKRGVSWLARATRCASRPRRA
jgi:hypothetical protein